MKECFNENRRKNVRLNMNISMHLVVFDAAARGLISGGEMIKLRKGAIIDISSSGLRLATDDFREEWNFHLLSGSILLALKFKLPDSERVVNAVGRIMWVKPNQNPAQYKYTAGIKFTDISSKDKDLLTDFIISHKLKMNKK